MDALAQTLSITGISMAVVFGVMAVLYAVIRLMVKAEE